MLSGVASLGLLQFSQGSILFAGGSPWDFLHFLKWRKDTLRSFRDRVRFFRDMPRHVLDMVHHLRGYGM